MGLFYFNLKTLLISHTVWLCKNNKLHPTNCLVTGGSENQYILDKFSFEDQYSLRISITDCIQLLYQYECGYFIPFQFNYVFINTEVQYNTLRLEVLILFLPEKNKIYSAVTAT